MAQSPGALSTALTGTDNDLDFTARYPGPESASLKIEYLDPGTDTADASVAVTFDPDTLITLISVTLGYASAAIDSLASEVETAIEADPIASALVTVANKAANDGSGVVTALTATALSAGTPDATTGGYGTQDNMEDDGWIQTSDGTNYSAIALVDGIAVAQTCDDATALLKATYEWKKHWLLKGNSPLRLSGPAAD